MQLLYARAFSRKWAWSSGNGRGRPEDVIPAGTFGCLAGGRGAGGDDETEREGAAAGRRARAGACVGGGSPIGDGEGRVQSGNFKPGTWLGPRRLG